MPHVRTTARFVLLGTSLALASCHDAASAPMAVQPPARAIASGPSHARLVAADEATEPGTSLTPFCDAAIHSFPTPIPPPTEGISNQVVTVVPAGKFQDESHGYDTLAVDGNEHVYVGVSGPHPATGLYSYFIRRFEPTGDTAVLAGGEPGYQDGEGAAARFAHISDLVMGTGGDLLIADGPNHRVRRLDPATGRVTTVAGTGTPGTADGASTSAELYRPLSLQVSSTGAIYVLEGCSPLRIRRIDPVGTVSTVMGSPEDVPNQWGVTATSMALDEANGHLYLLMGGEIKRLDLATKEVELFAGGPQDYAFRAGIGTQARFQIPSDIALDGVGNLFVTDSGNQCIRRIVLASRKVVNHAGNPFDSAWEGLDGEGWAAVIPRPTAMYVTPTMNAYFIDEGGRICRMPSTLGLL